MKLEPATCWERDTIHKRIWIRFKNYSMSIFVNGYQSSMLHSPSFPFENCQIHNLPRWLSMNKRLLRISETTSYGISTSSLVYCRINVTFQPSVTRQLLLECKDSCRMAQLPHSCTWFHCCQPSSAGPPIVIEVIFENTWNSILNNKKQ